MLYALRRTAVASARAVSTRAAQRSFSSVSVLRQGELPTACYRKQKPGRISATPTKPESKEDADTIDVFTTEIPGYRAPGQVPTNWEIAAGKERYEYLMRLKGEEPWPDMLPLYIDAKGTTKNPIIITGSDPEKYVGCTGWPVDSHELVWLTIREHRGFDRCPHCGNVFKYHKDKEDHGHH
ncbi:Cytochrome c oxidase subunit 4 [Borealophlyctis nickersoniae]|nr:Cytochrome c oxidase subunit 4 [Borealophlyctis nickersoniae]